MKDETLCPFVLFVDNFVLLESIGMVLKPC
jgi:hypothetical protein